MAADQAPEPSVCAGCGESFVCGVEAGFQTCWCMEKPTGLFEPDGSGRCFCPACLDRRISELSSPAA